MKTTRIDNRRISSRVGDCRGFLVLHVLQFYSLFAHPKPVSFEVRGGGYRE